MREIFNFVVVEDMNENWSMHWAPRSEQTIALCGLSTMPSNIDPDKWGKQVGTQMCFKWCEECARTKHRVLPMQR